MSSILEQYHSDFNELVETVYSAYKKKELVSNNKAHLSILYSALYYIDIYEFLSKEDIRQELSVMWLKYIKVYATTKPKVHIRTYLIRRSVWEIRDWFHKLARKKPIEILPKEESLHNFDFTIDLQFLLYGDKEGMLKDLTSYERYLIFLRFKEDKTIPEISFMVQKTSETVADHLSKILDKIKFNATIAAVSIWEDSP